MELNNEIYREIVGGRRSQSSIYIAINKKLMADISNQLKKLYTIVGADASNFFDRVTYPILAISCSHFSLPLIYISTFF